jgi:hypothetical protein
MTQTITQGSEPLELSGHDWRKILKGALIASIGAGLAQYSVYLSTGVAFDLRIWIGGILAVMINALWKFLIDTTEEQVVSKTN